MDKIKIKNYRCFKSEQRARIAPLTILVGENSAGKSSFLAIVRALWNLFHNHQVPNFNEEPFDYGTFDNIVCSGHIDDDKHLKNTFGAGFRVSDGEKTSQEHLPIWFEVDFGKSGTVPFPLKLKIRSEELKITLHSRGNNLDRIDIQTKRGGWKSKTIPNSIKLFKDNHLTAFPFIVPAMRPVNVKQSRGSFLQSALGTWETEEVEYNPLSKNGPSEIGESDWHKVEKLLDAIYLGILSYYAGKRSPYASSPVRTKPVRIYQSKLFTWDSEGNFAPMYLAHLSEAERAKWSKLKLKLEAFGSESGLFDEISIHTYENNGGGPFQVEVCRSDGQHKGKNRNLIDIGYGVSQILPVATELLRDDPTPLLLLQQPEIHLHPSAQAALGTLLLQTAHKEQIVIVESHSDHLLNRIRMDLRDGVNDSKPEDVSILYFESSNTDAKIHSLRIDGQGNVIDAPESYGRFFMNETKRSLNL